MDSDLVRDHEQLLDFLYACPVGLVEIDATGAVMMINPHAMKHLLPLAGGRSPANLFAMLEGCAPELRNMFDAFTAERGTVCDGHRIAVDMGVEGDDEEPKFLACTLVKLGSDRAIATVSDVTVLVAQERKLRLAEAWFASLINSVNDYAVLSLTLDGVVESSNPAFTRQSGQPPEEVVGRSLDEILGCGAATGALSLASQLRLAARDGWAVDESWQERKGGERYWCQRLFAARTSDEDDSVIGYSVVLRDVARDASDTTDLRRMLTCDHLTGAANRTHFLQLFNRELKHWWEERQPLSLILLDIDHFKAVNDRHGHPVGDLVLTQLTKVASAALRPTDLFARLGGEEFAVLLPQTPLSEATAIAERLRAAVAAMVVATDNGPLRVTASFGCAAAEDVCCTVRGLIKAADDQLYIAKRAGRDRVSSRAPLASVA